MAPGAHADQSSPTQSSILVADIANFGDAGDGLTNMLVVRQSVCGATFLPRPERLV